MSLILKEIIDNYLSDKWDAATLISTLKGFDEMQLQVVLQHIKEIEQKFGECKLKKVGETAFGISVRTDNPKDSGIDYHKSTYRR